MFTNIFKYGPEYQNKNISGRRNVLLTNPELDDLRNELLDKIGNILTDGDDLFQQIINNTINNNFPDIINNREGDTIQNIVDNSISNFSISDFNLDNSLLSWSFDINNDLYTFSNVSINSRS